jgi:hypothetical protein
MQAYSPAGVDRAVEVQANDKLVIEFERAQRSCSRDSSRMKESDGQVH